MNPRIIVDVEGLTLTEEDREFLAHPLITGTILFSRNYQSRVQLKHLTTEIHSVNPDLMIVVDQEGGRVQRFHDEFTELAAMNTFGKTYAADPSQAKNELAKQINTTADELLSIGVDATLIPVVDLDHGRSEIIRHRSFGASIECVTALAETVIDTLQAKGMPATIKHFPGHGYVVADSHLELPTDSRDFVTLEAQDLQPFIRLLPKADFVMPAHIIFSAVDDRPVGFSPVWLKDILRKRYGFKGRIMTDDLSMQGAAAWGGYAERAEAAIDAGCDILLVCNNRQGAIEIVDSLTTTTA